MERFAQRLESYVDQIAQYDDPTIQGVARALIPVEELEEKAAIALAKEGKNTPTKEEQDHFFLIQLLYWFKTSFSWMNSPPCDFCASKTHHIGMGEPSDEDLHFGANRVEIYSCEMCGTITRFPRYNSPAKLMETQCGRCGEWANCFTFYCIAFGYDARLILDFTDHVWTECYSSYLDRWMHLDPCEASYDTPLLYEKGWGKKLNYVVAIAKHGMYDVTKRYTRNWQEVLTRRDLVNEDDAEEALAFLTAVQRSKLEVERLDVLEQRDRQELQELSDPDSRQVTQNQLPGRQSGSEEWRRSRGEMGSDQHSGSDRGFCPERICVDDHVGKIYRAIGLICSQERSKAEEELVLLQGFLLELKKQPFKTRRLKLKSDDASFRFMQLSAAAEWVDAIGMEKSTCESGEIQVSLKGSPGGTSLALVTALEIVEKVTKTIATPDLSSLKFMIEGKRLCGGSTYATGEQMPSGTAQAAFDGQYSTKWEEPDGAKGATLVYHLQSDEAQQIVGYDLTSGNDCSERDPSDWLLEGSSDGGKTWRVLDKRNGEIFQERFERRCFKVAEEQYPCNVLRLQFISVRDSTKTSRLQISCVDFYTRK